MNVKNYPRGIKIPSELLSDPFNDQETSWVFWLNLT